MNERQYWDLCKASDCVLSNNNIERIAIAWLHIVNEHPTNLAKYAQLFGKKGVELPLRLKSALRSLKQYYNNRSKKKPWLSSSPLPIRSDVIIITNLINKDQLGVNKDFYFGTLPDSLSKNGNSTVVLLRDNVGIDSAVVQSHWQRAAAPRVIFSKTLTFQAELRMRRSLAREARCIKTKSKNIQDSFLRSVYLIAAKQAMSTTTIDTLRFYYLVRQLVAAQRPRAIVLPYEGHAWERLAFAAARSFDPSIRCIGYHHTILFPRQHALMRSLGAMFDPDIILTAGDITKDVINNNCQYKEVKIESVGIQRHEQVVVDMQNKISLDHGQACLVIPDGTVDECLTIFDFVLEIAKNNAAISFIIRMHPVLPFQTVMNHDRRLATLPSNVELSNLSCAEDFKRSRWALYRGSGLVIHALVSGLRPIYVSRENELNIDPLYKLHQWRRTVKSPEEFVNQIECDKKRKVDDLMAEYNDIQPIIKKYFLPINLLKFSDIISKCCVESNSHEMGVCK